MAYILPVTGTGPNQTVSVAEHEAAINAALQQIKAAAVAAASDPAQAQVVADEIEALVVVVQQSVEEAGAARDAAEDAVQYTYLRDDAAEISAIVGMVEGETAFARDTEHRWIYSGSAWVDEGPGPTALKAPLANPDFIGVPLVDTAEPETETRQAASTAFVRRAIGPELRARLTDGARHGGRDVRVIDTPEFVAFATAFGWSPDQLGALRAVLSARPDGTIVGQQFQELEYILGPRDVWPDDAIPLIAASGVTVGSLFRDGTIRLDLRVPEMTAPTVRDVMPYRSAWYDGDRANLILMDDDRLCVALHDDSLNFIQDPPWFQADLFGVPFVDGGAAYLDIEGFSPTPIATETEVTGILATGLHGRQAYVMADTADGPRRITFATAPENSLSDAVVMVWHIPITGQSNAVGWHTDPLTDPGPHNAGRASMFDIGVRVLGTSHTPAEVDDFAARPAMASFVDLMEQDAGQSARTPATTFARGLIPHLAADIGLHFACSGIGGTTYAVRKSGQEPFRNLILSIERSVTIARLSGQECEVPLYITVDGESEGSITAAAYTAQKIEERGDIDAAAKARTGQSRDVICVMDQNSYQVRESALAQLALAQDQPDLFVCIGPKYHLAYNDNIHISGISQGRRGYEFARAAKRKLVDGANPLPLHLVSAVRAGDTIVCTWGGDIVSPVVIDTTLVTDPGDYGLKFTQTGGAAVSITSIMQTGALETTIVLSDVPTGTDQVIEVARHPDVAFGGPTLGCRANFRDSSADTGSVNGTDYPLHRWAAHQIINIT